MLHVCMWFRCVYICMCVNVYLCVEGVCVCVWYRYVYIFLCICVYVCCRYVCVVQVCVCVSVYVFVCVCLCVLRVRVWDARDWYPVSSEARHYIF